MDMPQEGAGSMRNKDLPFHITRADRADIPRLVEIDIAANNLFADTGLIRDEELGEHVPPHVLADAIIAREVFVMRHKWTAQAAGFTMTSVRDDTLYLDQVSVHPDEGRQGLGRQLVRRVIGDARTRGFRTVTLSTFRELPWNGPFYKSLGFREIKPEKLADWMREIEAVQAEKLDVSARCFMKKNCGLVPFL